MQKTIGELAQMFQKTPGRNQTQVEALTTRASPGFMLGGNPFLWFVVILRDPKGNICWSVQMQQFEQEARLLHKMVRYVVHGFCLDHEFPPTTWTVVALKETNGPHNTVAVAHILFLAGLSVGRSAPVPLVPFNMGRGCAIKSERNSCVDLRFSWSSMVLWFPCFCPSRVRGWPSWSLHRRRWCSASITIWTTRWTIRRKRRRRPLSSIQSPLP